MSSLRSRLVVLLAALAAAVSIVATASSYAATDHQLSAQLDASLGQAARQFANVERGPLAPPGSGGAASGPVPSAPGSGPVPQGLGQPGGLFDLVVAQRLRANGDVAVRFGSVALPVSTAARSIARAGGGSLQASVLVDGAPYREVVIGLPRGGAVQVAQSLSQIDGVLASLRWRFILLDVGLIAFAALIGWMIARRIATPLEQLAETAETVAADGSLERDVPTAGRDEVGRLGRAFAEMLAALRISKSQQQQLVRDAGHELRTPLTSIRSNIDLLRRHGSGLGPDVMERLLSDLDTELRELSGLMDEVVELATDSRASEAPVLTRVDELVEGVVERSRTRLGREIDYEGLPWSAEIRPKAMERAVSNLIENAAKFSEQGTTIAVETAPGTITVRDHGPGFSTADLPHVFDRFYRAETARSLPGSGLGLSIVRQVAEALGGTVQAENAIDGGAVLTLHIPMLPPTMTTEATPQPQRPGR